MNSVARVLEHAARVAVGFFLNPLLVSGLGSSGFGVWQVLMRLIGFAGPATGRPGHALRWTLANRQASEDYDEKRRYVGSAAGVWLIFLPFVLAIGAFLAWYAPLWLRTAEAQVWPVRLTAALLVVNVAAVNLTELPRSALEGENLGYKRMGWSAAFVLFGGALVAAALYLDLGLPGVAAATLAASMSTGLFFLFVTRAHVQWFGIKRPAKGGVRAFLGLSGWFLSWHTIMKVMRASDVVMLGLLASVELVTDYTIAKYLPATVFGLVTVVVFGVTPGLGRLVGAGDFLRAAGIRREIMVFSWLLVTGAGATILLWNDSFVGLWIGSEFALGPVPTFLIVTMVAQFVFIRNDSAIIDVTLELRPKVLIGVVSAGLALSLAWVMVGLFDEEIVGLCVGFITGRALLSVTYPWLVARHLGVSLSEQARGSLRPAFVTALLFGTAGALSRAVAVGSWPGLAAGACLTLAVFTVASFYGGLAPKGRQQLVRRLRLAATGIRVRK